MEGGGPEEIYARGAKTQLHPPPVPAASRGFLGSYVSINDRSWVKSRLSWMIWGTIGSCRGLSRSMFSVMLGFGIIDKLRESWPLGLASSSL